LERYEHREDLALRFAEIRLQLLNCLSAFHRLQPVHNPGFEIVRSFHFVASSSSFLPRNKASGMVLTYFAVVTLRFAWPKSSLAAKASPVSWVKIVAAPLRPGVERLPFNAGTGTGSCGC
jgi:hypothetical protein